ncbi:LysE family transporter [Peribacillus sp. NPDC097284]|uniref:LysE family transporter n=1 Tax=Peribacillus sp. NPDC097284 TaxID=3364401 RepID=UPI0038235B98
MSVHLLLSYFFLGITLAAPIGPVNSARIDKGIKNGFWHAWIVGAGSMIADAIFMILVYIGMVRFLEIPVVQIFLWLFGGFVLIYTGFESVVQSNKITLNQYRNRDSLLSCFLTGFIMSVTSPLSILFWLGIYGSILAKTASSYGTSQVFIYSGMIFLGLTCWDFFVALLTNGFRRFLTERSLRVISITSGASLLGFGGYFAYQGIKAIVS